jgi:hypothetical protein
MSSEGFKYCLVGINRLSKALTVIPTAIMSTKVSIDFTEMAFCMIGRKGKLLTDSEPYFKSGRFKRMVQMAESQTPDSKSCPP